MIKHSIADLTPLIQPATRYGGGPGERPGPTVQSGWEKMIVAVLQSNGKQ
jgi:hypothetical protein